MPPRMKLAWFGLTACLVLVLASLGGWLVAMPRTTGIGSGPGPGGGTPETPVLRLALIPERDIFEQRRRYRALADALEPRIGRRIELVTLSTYRGVLDEWAAARIDGAFLGSMIAVLVHDRLGARVLAKPVTAQGVSRYRGVVFVRADRGVQRIEDLTGQPIALVRTTTAGNLFPVYELAVRGMLHDASRPVFHWAGTHDDAIREVAEGRVVAGAAKDLRLGAYLAAHPGAGLRVIATGAAVPNNALLVREDADAGVVARLRRSLLAMHRTPAGSAALGRFGAARFEPCDIGEYAAVYQMTEAIGSDWAELGIDGPPPSRPVDGSAGGERGTDRTP